MSLCLVKLPPALAERIKAEPNLLNQLWFDAEDWDEPAEPDAEIAAIDRDRDTLFEDFLGLSRHISETPDKFPWMHKALNGTGDEIDFDFGYGNGFIITTQDSAQIADGLTQEGWWQPGHEVTLISHAIAAFYRTAAADGRTVIGGVA